MNNRKGHKLIFEGAELVGKSYIISEVYNFLEKKYNTHNRILNGCHWFNSDVGIFGTKYGKEVVENYVKMATTLSEENVIFEKLHISDLVYNKIYNSLTIQDYSDIESNLLALGAKIILCVVNNDEEIFKRRLQDRISMYPHYDRIVQEPRDYLKQQNTYIETCKQTGLPLLTVNTTTLPDQKIVDSILTWIGEKS